MPDDPVTDDLQFLEPEADTASGPVDGPQDLRARLLPRIFDKMRPSVARRLPRNQVAGLISDVVIDGLDSEPHDLDLLQQRTLVMTLVDDLLNGRDDQFVGQELDGEEEAPPDPPADDQLAVSEASSPSQQKMTVEDAKLRVKPLLMERIDVGLASSLDHQSLTREIDAVVDEIRKELRLTLNHNEHMKLVSALVDDMIGLGPLEPLLADETITDVMVNGPKQVYVERGGKLQLTGVTFQDDAHVMNIATRIVTRIGRRIDESSPICDARLEDGSRVNVIAPPLAIDGPSLSIRKFSQRRITLDMMAKQGNISPAMAKLVKIAARCRLNILISGGTGSGKTTLLNACSQLIDPGERIVTVEDAAELQLQQPHVVRLETRPPSLEGKGEVNIRDLVKNSLRMRPDRIIVGEVRGSEAIDMLQAMNTGHDGSMATVHANKPRDALVRLENMVSMAAASLPPKAMRTQIASAINMIIQISRMRDGMRRVTSVTEICGMEGEVIISQDLFTFEFEGEDEHGRLRGNFRSSGVRPHFMPRAEYFGLGQALMELI